MEHVDLVWCSDQAALVTSVRTLIALVMQWLHEGPGQDIQKSLIVDPSKADQISCDRHAAVIHMPDSTAS
jgi:hypothetical protein